MDPTHFLHIVIAWFNAEYWGVSWPNIFAPSVWTLLGIGLAHWHAMTRQAGTRDEHSNRLDEITKRVDSLIDRLIPGDDDD